MQKSNLRNTLANNEGNTIAHVTTMTSQKSKVSVNAAKALGIDPNDVMKYSEIQVQLGSNYSTRVNNQREREGLEKDFIAEKAFYRMVSGALAVNKKDESKEYAIVTPMPNTKGESHYLVNGKKVDFSLIQKLFKPSSLKSYGNQSQGTAKETKHYAIGLDSITRLAINGKVIL